MTDGGRFFQLEEGTRVRGAEVGRGRSYWGIDEMDLPISREGSLFLLHLQWPRDGISRVILFLAVAVRRRISGIYHRPSLSFSEGEGTMSECLPRSIRFCH